MGKKHAKKRFFCVKYSMKPDKKFDELVTLSKKKIGPTKILEYNVVLDLINEEDKIIVDTIKWNGNAKKSGIEMGDYITEFKIENSNRPNKKLVYPIALFLLLVFGYLNKRRTS